MDQTFLQWPFFEERHRKLAAELETWAQSHLGEKETSSAHHDEYAESKKLVGALGHGGWLKYAVPKKFGGVNETLDVRSLCLLRETIARYSGLADSAFAMQGLGSYPITAFGSSKLQERYLPKIGAGAAIAAFAISEKATGSDIANIATTANKNGAGFVLNGSKTWISNAGIADSYVVFARTGEAPGAKGVSAFVVDADAPGLKVSEKITTMAPHPLGSLEFKNCKVPAEQMLGEAGDGIKIALTTLDLFRSTVGAAALGFARRALDEALAHVRQRRIFNQQLSEFQMTQQKLADMATAIDASALLVYRAAWTKDKGAKRVTREAAMAKSFATDQGQAVIDAAVQLLGGLGVVSGNPVERLYREIRPLRIYEGTSEIQRIVIARELLKSEGDTE